VPNNIFEAALEGVDHAVSWAGSAIAAATPGLVAGTAHAAMDLASGIENIGSQAATSIGEALTPSADFAGMLKGFDLGGMQSMLAMSPNQAAPAAYELGDLSPQFANMARTQEVGYARMA